MSQPDLSLLLTTDAAQQIRLAAKSMRDLAFGLEQYASEPCFTLVNKISVDLGRIGWNALYTSQLMADLAKAIQEEANDYSEKIDKEIYCQHIDALLSAVNYFSRSVIILKRAGKNIQDDGEIKLHLTELYDRLKEVTRESRSF